MECVAKYQMTLEWPAYLTAISLFVYIDYPALTLCATYMF